MTLVPVAVFLIFIVSAAGGPAEFVNTATHWLRDFVNECARWVGNFS